jgi:hypothetical protein
MNARWLLPPWRLRPAVVEEPVLSEQERELLTTGLAGFCEHGVGMLDECLACTEVIELRAQLEVALKQRDNALARGDVAELGMRAAAAEVEAATKKLAELQAYVHDLENRSVSDEAQAWKRQAEQDRANCLAMQQQLLDQRAANQIAELEHLWETDRAFVDPAGRAKVLGASS